MIKCTKDEISFIANISVCDNHKYISSGSCIPCPGHCRNGGPCNKTTGQCDNGCACSGLEISVIVCIDFSPVTTRV